MRQQFGFQTSWGWMVVEEESGRMTAIHLPREKQKEEKEGEPSPLLLEAKQQILSYLNGERREILLPYTLNLPPFSKKALEMLREIPYGQTKTYRELAQMLENPRAYRAVGNAMHRNPLPLLLPCHRILGTDGSLTGFAGGVEMKKKLLILEGALLSA